MRPHSFDNYGFGNLLLIDLHNGYALLHAIDVTAGDPSARVIPSTAFVGGESGRLAGAAHIYRTP